jgi:hypothetical protein
MIDLFVSTSNYVFWHVSYYIFFSLIFIDGWVSRGVGGDLSRKFCFQESEWKFGNFWIFLQIKFSRVLLFVRNFFFWAFLLKKTQFWARKKFTSQNHYQSFWISIQSVKVFLKEIMAYNNLPDSANF